MDLIRSQQRTSPVASDTDAPGTRLDRAADRLADWGFLADPDLPDHPGPASLIVALRESPTLRHYDPETVEFWSTVDGRGTRQLITRQTRTPLSMEAAWGEIRIVDRLGVTNEYLEFGGRCDAGMVGDTLIVVFTSPAPILRRGGHSQGWDAGADAIGAFFGRLLVTVDYVPGFEAQLASADPITRYVAFIRDADERERRMRQAFVGDRPFDAIVRSEAARLRRDHPEAWSAADQVLASVGQT